MGNKETNIGILFTIIFAALAPFAGADWIGTLGGNPSAFVFWSLEVFSIGFLLSTIIYGNRQKEQATDAVIEMEKMNAREVGLKAELAFANKNAEQALQADGENYEHVKLCQRVLNDLQIIPDTERLQYLHDKINGPIEESCRYEKAFNDLLKYNCVDGFACSRYAGRQRCVITGSETVRVLKADYPSLKERRDTDLEIKMMETAEATVRELTRAIAREKRM